MKLHRAIVISIALLLIVTVVVHSVVGGSSVDKTSIETPRNSTIDDVVHATPPSSPAKAPGQFSAETTIVTNPERPASTVVITDLKTLTKSDVDPVRLLSEAYDHKDLVLISRLTARSIPVDEKIKDFILVRKRGATESALLAKLDTSYPGLEDLAVRDELTRWIRSTDGNGESLSSGAGSGTTTSRPPLMNKQVNRVLRSGGRD